MLEKAFLGAIVAGTGQARQIDEQWDFLEGVRDCARRKIEVEIHLTLGSFGIVSELDQKSSKAGNLRLGGEAYFTDEDRHSVSSSLLKVGRPAERNRHVEEERKR